MNARVRSRMLTVAIAPYGMWPSKSFGYDDVAQHQLGHLRVPCDLLPRRIEGALAEFPPDSGIVSCRDSPSRKVAKLSDHEGEPLDPSLGCRAAPNQSGTESPRKGPTQQSASSLTAASRGPSPQIRGAQAIPRLARGADAPAPSHRLRRRVHEFGRQPADRISPADLATGRPPRQ